MLVGKKFKALLSRRLLIKPLAHQVFSSSLCLVRGRRKGLELH